jgi:hypothetical protein
MYGIGLFGAGFRQNELILEFQTKSMPSGFRVAAILEGTPRGTPDTAPTLPQQQA